MLGGCVTHVAPNCSVFILAFSCGQGRPEQEKEREGNTPRCSADLLTASLSPDSSNSGSDGAGRGGSSLGQALTETQVALCSLKGKA